jgi:hypothetical protein
MEQADQRAKGHRAEAPVTTPTMKASSDSPNNPIREDRAVLISIS